ncbi:MAG: hypothetical protein ACTSRA_00390 [Promethearchaeota archaeon]|nr:MAG: hypothetical protein [Helarchaeota virus Nidhogg Meg22_1012]URC17413.1 MAG: hypothetical protein [Helarchaeota virus Nidhogg Meg22_1214]
MSTSLDDYLSQFSVLPVDQNERFPQRWSVTINDELYTFDVRANTSIIDPLFEENPRLSLTVYDSNDEMLFTNPIGVGYEEKIYDEDGIKFRISVLIADIARENALGETGNFGTNLVVVVR